MTGQATKLGPGKLTIGDVATELDISCQLSKAKVEWDKDKEDDTEVLCGETIAGGTTYKAKLTGTVLLTEEMVSYTWTHKGEQQAFLFEPNDTWTNSVSGTLTVDPLDVGGDEVKKNMSVDFELDIVGEPEWGPTPAAAAAAREAREPADMLVG